MSGTFYCRSEFTAPWALALPPMKDVLMFHVVQTRPCWLEVEGAERLASCRPGDLALVPARRGPPAGERGRDCAAAGLFDLPREQVSDRYEILAPRRRRLTHRHGVRARSASTTRRPII